MGELELQFIGDIRVIRDKEQLALPPSRKTRGLLAYLALNPRAFRREQLCELLWEIPDDPRGSLRWSLSKLRRLVDDENTPRIIANRTHASFEPGEARIDVTELLALTGGELDATPLKTLVQAANKHTGEFLEGLELPNFHTFYTWHIGQREQITRAQARLNKTIALRLLDTPEQALPYAQTLARLDEQDEESHALIITLLLQLGRKQEAEQQARLARHTLNEAGLESGEILRRALEGGQPAPAIQGTRPLPASRSEGLKFAQGKIYGRDEEISTLIQRFNRGCEAPHAAFTLLRGDPGIGKSRLLQFVREMAQEIDACLLQADALESEIVRPFALWKDAFRRSQSITAPHVLDDDAPVERDRVFSGLSRVLAEEMANRPVVVIFDDLQWCDESSAAALHYILRMNRELPLMVLAAGREVELRDNTPIQQAIRGLRNDELLQEMILSPLAPEDICALITEESPESDAQRLARESGGNPLLAIELAKADSAGGGSGSLAELVRERLARLDDKASELVMWASVLAPSIDFLTLEKLTGYAPTDLDTALHSAEAQGMLTPSERGLKFSHDMISRSVYEEISASRRQQMHRRIAEQLEVDTALNLQLAADLAHHATKSGDPGLAARSMVAAGRLCLRFYANEDALNLALTGLDFAQHLPDAERVCLTLELGDVRLAAAHVHDWEEAADEFVKLAEEALDHGALPYARLGYHLASFLRWIHGDWADAQRDTLQAERVTRGASDEAHIIGMAETAKCLALLERELPQADAMLMEASSLAQRKKVAAPAIPVASGILRYYEGRMDEAEELLEEARALCKARGERINEFQANEYLLMIDLERGDFKSALRRSLALTEIGEKLPQGSELPFASAAHSLLQYARDGKADGLDDSLQALRDVDAKHRLSYVLNRLALAYAAREDHEQAISCAMEALACAEVLARPSEMLMSRCTLAQVYQATQNIGEFKEQLKALDALLSGSIAQWARARADHLLSTTKGAG